MLNLYQVEAPWIKHAVLSHEDDCRIFPGYALLRFVA